jgi:DHA2 family multidrug resistance protein
MLGDNALRLSTLLGHAETGARVAAMADAEVTRQAMMIAYVNDFWLMMWALILMLPVVLILSPVRVPRGVAAEPITLSE